MSYSNPKAYYNQAQYTSGSLGPDSSNRSDQAARPPPPPSSSSSKAYDTVIHKPDEITPSDLNGPPPPPSAPPAYAYPPPDEAAPSAPPASSIPPTTPSSREYPTYGAVAAQAGLLDPAKAYMDRQPRPPSAHSSRDAVATPSWSNPHIPRDWAQNGQEQQATASSMHSSPSPSAQHIRFGPRSRGYDDDDDDDDPGCWRKWCKYLFLAILIWLVFLKYGDILTWGGWGGDSPSAAVCRGHNSIVWDDLPSSIVLDKNAWVTIEGHVTGGKINVHRGSRKGSIETRVRTNSPTLLDALEYELHPGENTQLELRFPAMSVMPQHHDCLEIEMDIWVPERSEEIHVEGSNVVVDVVDALDGMDWLDIKTINAMIRMQGGWFGERLELETEHGEINTAGPIVTSDNAHMKTTGGAIRVGSIMSRNTIDLKASDGAIHVSGSLQADSRISAETSNAEVHLDTVKSRHLDVTTSNGWIQLNHAVAPHITARTSNDRINVQVEEVVEPNVELTTSNGPITAHVTTYFAGTIQVSTSSHNQAIVQDAWNRVDLDIDEPSMKQGSRMGGGNGHLTLSTSNADASIFLDIQPDIGYVEDN